MPLKVYGPESGYESKPASEVKADDILYVELEPGMDQELMVVDVIERGSVAVQIRFEGEEYADVPKTMLVYFRSAPKHAAVITTELALYDWVRYRMPAVTGSAEERWMVVGLSLIADGAIEVFLRHERMNVTTTAGPTQIWDRELRTDEKGQG